MSLPGASTTSDRGARSSRRFAAGLAAVPLLAVGIVDAAAVLGRHATAAPHRSSAHHSTSGQTATEAQAARVASSRAGQVRALLRRRGEAVLAHDRAEWRSTLDPANPRFVRAQLQVFDNLRRVQFASFGYSLDRGRSLAVPRAERYGAPTWAPYRVSLEYRLRGFDKRPTNLPQYPTFVHRPTGWYLTSLNDFAARGKPSSADLWDFGPVIAVRTPSVLVLGHPGSLDVMRALATEVAGDIPHVTAVWGRQWSRRVVVLVPATQHELGQVVDDYGDLDQIAAVATAEVQIGTGRPAPVGDRIGINPANWPRLSELGKRIVLTHELTHVATRAVTSAATPTWLAEGFADYVGYLGSGVPTPFVAQELAAAVRSGHAPEDLPTGREFDGDSSRLSQAYEGAWLACRLIAGRWGQQALVHFYIEVGRSQLAPHAAVDVAMRRLFHISASEFVRRWRGFLRVELG